MIRLICWDESVAGERGEQLRAGGRRVDATPFTTSRLIGQFRDKPPSAIVIDLDRQPTRGRYIGIMLRRSRWTRHIPLVFAGGQPDKVERVRKDLPDAVFTSWQAAAAAVGKAVRRRLPDPVRPPDSALGFYPETPLGQKLGIRAQMRLALLRAPEGFEEMLGDLPEGVDIEREMTARTELAIWFVRSRLEMETVVGQAGARLGKGASIWVAYPKGTSRFKVDFNQFDVRAAALEVGMVDYKICAIDRDWTGMKFTRKK
ncbi:MAG TPA: hypothetical protein VJ732_14135 [Bryobacteraceae bacterium]|nr:hypothetical protein [Bryobacteraceae bacterium]